MPAEEYIIEVSKRDAVGKANLRRLRMEGFIPVIYYAPDQKEAISLKADIKELHQALHSEALIYHMSVDGKRKNVLIKEIQYHPVTDEILHVDFQGVRMDAEVELKVPVRAIGRPVGVKDEGGQLHHALLEIEIRCRASEIPSHFDVDITEMHIGSAIHASDLEIGNTELVTPPDALVLSVAHIRGVVEEVVEEAEEEEFVFEEGAEGAAEAETKEKKPSKE